MVIRVNQDGNLCNSRPCMMCFDYIVRAGIRKVYYSNELGEIDVINVKQQDVFADDQTTLQISHGVRCFVKIHGHMCLKRLPVSLKTYRIIVRTCEE